MADEDRCQLTVATFDKLAEHYAEKYFALDIYDRYLQRFADHIVNQDARVLDAACGPGNVSNRLLELRPDFKLLGIDLKDGSPY